MKKKWTVTRLIAVASLSVLEIILELMASSITVATGFTMASGVLTTIIRPLFLINALFIMDLFGTAFMFMTINGIFALFMAISGPPGFFAKVPIYMVLGLIEDAIYAALKKRNKLATVLVIGGVDEVLNGLAVIFVGRLLNIPGIDNLLKVVSLPVFIIGVFAMGALGGWLGLLVFNRIKDTAIVTRIQAI